MRRLLIQFSDLIILLASVVLLFTAGRAYFYFNFQHHFETFNNSQLLNAFFSGLEYDLKVVMMINSLFILLYFLPNKIYNSTIYLSILKFLYFVINCFALFLNMLDVSYFDHSGKRLSIISIKTEILRMFNDLVNLKFEISIKNYLILLVCLIIFIIILRSLLDFVQRRDFESKSLKWINTAIVFLLIGLYSWLSFKMISDNKTWLNELYQKADRKLAPLVMNNPYMLICSATSDLPENTEYWDQVKFQSEKTYDSITTAPIKHIGLFFIDNSDSSLNISNNQITKRIYQFNVLNKGYQTVDRYLDEALLSFPSIFPYEFYQSVYSLNDFESLPQILEKESFVSNLYSIGYTDKHVKLLKNFHGFENSKSLDSILIDEVKLNESILDDLEKDSSLKTFDVVIVSGASKNIALEIIKSYLQKTKNNGISFVFNAHNFTSEQNVGFVKSFMLYLPNDQTVYCPINNIVQCIDIKPSILHYIHYKASFIAYGSSVFACNENSIITSNGIDNYYLLKDSLLVNYSNKETKSLLLLRNKKFLKEDFKDSLAVEKIDMENRIHAIFQDFEYRTQNNKLK